MIGLPGEKVQIKNGRIYVNGKKTKAFSSQKILSAGLAADEITLKSKQYFVVGDNYNNSEDSRSASVGNIKKNKYHWKGRYQILAVVNRGKEK